MSWLDDEANANKQKEEAERHSEEVLRRSNYWAAIIQRIGQEIEAINSHEHWKAKLAGFPLRLQEPLGGDGYQVSKSGYPAVVVKIQNKQDHIVDSISGSGSDLGDMLESTHGYSYFTMSALRQHQSGSQWMGR